MNTKKNNSKTKMQNLEKLEKFELKMKKVFIESLADF